MTGVLRDLFGPGTWGTGGNLVAWIICGILAGLWVRAKLRAHHLAELAQAARHHKDQIALLQEQHAEQLAVAKQNHQALHRRLDEHADLIAAVAAQPSAPAAEQVLPSRRSNRP